MIDNRENHFKPGEFGFDEDGNMRVPRDQKPIYGDDEAESKKNQPEDKKM